MSDTFFSEIGTNTAVSVCQKISDDINRHLKVLGYQLANCQGCTLQMECAGVMRIERLDSGTCVYRAIG